MRIKEVEQLVGISAKNIRFYEKEGLLQPQRNYENGYRQYTQKDVEALKQIKLLRKLGIPIHEILLLQQGIISLEDEMKTYINYLNQKIEEAEHMKEICKEIEKGKITLETLDTDRHLQKIEQMEKKGFQFKNIVEDFLSWWRKEAPIRMRAFTFEPEEPILNKNDFTMELIQYCEREKRDLTILHESMEPIVEIDGVKYLCILETPQMFPVIFFACHTYGFKFVSVYHFE